MFDPTLCNRRNNREFLKGTLIKEGEKGFVFYEFFYGTHSSRKYAVTASVMPFEFVKPTETIKTSQVDLPFAQGDAITLNDGKKMTVKDIEYEEKAERALFGMDVRTAAIITLDGGAK